MKVLFLGYASSSIIPFLRDTGCLVTPIEERLSMESSDISSYDMLISFGYRYILKASVLDCFKDRAFNLHISLLPWNRGAHPNFWALFDGTPSGVTIHHLDAGIDTGPIAFQKTARFDWDNETLRTSHAELIAMIEKLFIEKWDVLRTNAVPKVSQEEKGTTYRKRDLERVFPLLSNGWDTPALEVMRLGKRCRDEERAEE